MTRPDQDAPHNSPSANARDAHPPGDAAPADTPPQDPAPDWSLFHDDVHCPLCAYNLRGLTTPRCPECGHRFDWRELLEAARRAGTKYFEHQDGLAVRAFFRTAWDAFRPARFWEALSPVHPSRPYRLLAYWVWAAALFAVYVRFQIPVARAAVWGVWWRLNRPRQMSRFDFLEYVIAEVQWSDFMHRDVLWIALPLIAPWLILGALVLFQATLRRARIRLHHLMRVAIHCADPMLAIATGLVLSAVFIVIGGASPTNLQLASAISFAAILLCWLIVTHRLYSAIKRYLRLPGAAAITLLVQVVATISLANLYLAYVIARGI